MQQYPSKGFRVTRNNPERLGSRSMAAEQKVVYDPAIADLLHRLAEMPPIREVLVSRVKREIAQGRYITPDRIDAAANRLMEDLQ